MSKVKVFSALLAFLSITECKKTGHEYSKKSASNAQSVEPSVEPSTAQDTITDSQLSLVDGSALGTPQATVSLGNVCWSSTYKIHVNSYDPNTQYFQIRMCDPNDPTQCLPASSNSGFSDVDVEVPNLYSDKNIKNPIVQLQSCVRPYIAENPNQTCSAQWTTLSTPPISTNSVASSLVWGNYVNQTKFTDQCFAIRNAFIAYKQAKQGQTMDPQLQQIIDQNANLNVDECQHFINSGGLQALQAQLASQSQTPTGTATERSNGLGLAAGVDPALAGAGGGGYAFFSSTAGILYFVGMGVTAVGMAGFIAYAVKDTSARKYKKLAETMDFMKKLDLEWNDNSKKIKPHKLFNYYFSAEWETGVEQLSRKQRMAELATDIKKYIDVEKIVNDNFHENWGNPTDGSKIEVDEPMAKKNGVDWKEIQKIGGKPQQNGKVSIEPAELKKIEIAALEKRIDNFARMIKSPDYAEKFSKQMEATYKRLAAANPNPQDAKKTFDEVHQSAQEKAKTKGKSAMRYGIGGGAFVIVGLATMMSSIVPLVVDTMHLADTPEGILNQKLSDIRKQITNINADLAKIWAQIAACEGTTL